MQYNIKLTGVIFKDMISITQSNVFSKISFIPSIDAKQVRKKGKIGWIRFLIFLDRMAITRIAHDLQDHDQRHIAKLAIKNLGKSHAAKMRLVGRLSKQK